MSAEFEQLVAQFEQFQSRIKNVDDQLANLGQLRGEIEQLEATATSGDRAVTVVAGPGGSVKDIRLTDKALAQSPQALSAALMSTIQQAVAEAARKQAGIVDGHLGGEPELTEQVIDAQAQLFGTSADELRAQLAEEGARSRSAGEEYDDYAEQRILRSSGPEERITPPPSAGGSAGAEFLKNLFDQEDQQ